MAMILKLHHLPTEAKLQGRERLIGVYFGGTSSLLLQTSTPSTKTGSSKLVACIGGLCRSIETAKLSY